MVARAKADINSLNHNNEIEILKRKQSKRNITSSSASSKENAAAQAIDQAAIAKNKKLI